MLYEALRLLEPKMLNVLDTTPSGVLLHMDLAGKWDINDFVLLWANKIARKQSGHRIDTGRLIPSTKANHFTFQSAVNELRELTAGGTKHADMGFIGPMNVITTKPTGESCHIEASLMYGGAIMGVNHIFLMIQHERCTTMNLPWGRAGDESNPVLAKLTPMEQRVAIAICRGATTVSMADEFCLSERTIENHRANIRKKLGITDRQQSIAEALNGAPKECATK